MSLWVVIWEREEEQGCVTNLVHDVVCKLYEIYKIVHSTHTHTSRSATEDSIVLQMLVLIPVKKGYFVVRQRQEYKGSETTRTESICLHLPMLCVCLFHILKYLIHHPYIRFVKTLTKFISSLDKTWFYNRKKKLYVSTNKTVSNWMWRWKRETFVTLLFILFFFFFQRTQTQKYR